MPSKALPSDVKGKLDTPIKVIAKEAIEW